MANRLLLNNIEVDMGNEKLTRKLQISDISSLTTRKSSFSYTMKLPKTAKNTAIFDFLGSFGNISRKPFEKLEATYIMDGIYIINNGIAIISETGGNYNINILDGFVGFSEQLKGKKLKDLDIEVDNHYLTPQNVINSWSNESGYIYALADFGFGFSEKLRIDRIAPSIYTHTLLKYILQYNNIVFEGDFFDTDINFKNEVIAPMQGYEIINPNDDVNGRGGVTSDTLSKSHYNSVVVFEEDYTLIDNGLSGASVVNGEIVFSEGGVYLIHIELTYAFDLNTITQFEIKKNGEVLNFIKFDSYYSNTKIKELTGRINAGDVISASVITQIYHDITYTTNVIIDISKQIHGQIINPYKHIGEMLQTDFINDVINRYGLIVAPTSTGNKYEVMRLDELLSDNINVDDWSEKLINIESENYNSGFAQENTATFQYPENVEPTKDGVIEIDNPNAQAEKSFFSSNFQIPNISIIKNNINIYSLPIWNDKPIKKYYNVPYSAFSDNSALLIDGTVETRAGNSVTSYKIIEKQAKYKISGSVKEITDVLICFFGSGGFISSQYQGMGNTTNYTEISIDLPANCDDLKISGTSLAKGRLLIEKQTSIPEPKTISYSIMNIERHNHPIHIGYFEEHNEYRETQNIPFLSLSEISMQNYLDKNYRNLKKIVSNYKKVNYNINLSVIDIYNLDFFRLKYFKQTGRYNYLNSIQYTENQPAKVETIEIVDFFPNLPPSQIGDISVTIPKLGSREITLTELTENYIDPENDYPYIIKIIDGFNSNTLISQNGVVIDSATEILATELNLTIEDTRGDLSGYGVNFRFSIMDVGSRQYSEVTGKIYVTILSDENINPVANAGSDFWFNIPRLVDEPVINYIPLDGSLSTATPFNIVNSFWKIEASPIDSDAVIVDNLNLTTYLKLDNSAKNVGYYDIILVVINEYGAENFDKIRIFVTY